MIAFNILAMNILHFKYIKIITESFRFRMDMDATIICIPYLKSHFDF